MSADLPDSLCSLAVRAAAEGGLRLLAAFRRPAEGLAAKSSRTDLVSAADHAAERAVLSVIRAERPDDAVLAEEGGATAGATGLRWVVDPLDGTINYLWGIPHWGVSIAVEDDDGVLAAVVHDPCRAETFRATRGGGAWLGGERLAVNRPARIDDALLGTGFNYRREERARQAARMADTLTRARDIRRFGAAALDLAWVAAGRLDGFFERGVERWDWAAGSLLVEEAGGEVRVLPAAPPRPAGVVAAHPDLVGELVGLSDG